MAEFAADILESKLSDNDITGLVLAGGRGSRMGNVDKGLQPFRGTTLVEHVLQRFAPQVARVAISANRSRDAYAALGAPLHADLLADELAGFEGPLAGLQAGLRHCATPLLATAPCDSPFLPEDLVQRLRDALLAQDADVALAVTMDADDAGTARKQPHPVFALMKVGVLPRLDAYLAGGGRKMDGWHDGLKVAEVLFNDAAAFRNINTLEELQREDRAQRLHDLTCDVDPCAMPVRRARQVIERFVRPVRGVEKVALRAALGRVLAEDVISPISVPAHDNSAMDGFAFAGAALSPDHPSKLKVIGTDFAGRPSGLHPGPGECLRIMTGAVMPAGCDTVLPQERAEGIEDDWVTIAPRSVRTGDNRRLAGEDLMAGRPALAAGKLVRPADLGLIASLGIAEVPVQRRLRVAFFSTGDELRSVGEPLAQGCVYDSNRYTLFGMLTRLGCELVDMGIVKDDPAALEAALRDACQSADAIVTSGGVSAGAADYTRDIMARLGEVAFWTIGMRPGRPMAFGRIGADGHEAFLFGLPGNPVAVMVSFYFFARPALLRMMGADAPADLLVHACSAEPIRKRQGRTEFQRGVLSIAPDGRREVRITGAQGSGILRSMTEANCIVVLPDERGNVAAGEPVEVLMFEGLI